MIKGNVENRDMTLYIAHKVLLHASLKVPTELQLAFSPGKEASSVLKHQFSGKHFTEPQYAIDSL